MRTTRPKRIRSRINNGTWPRHVGLEDVLAVSMLRTSSQSNLTAGFEYATNKFWQACGTEAGRSADGPLHRLHTVECSPLIGVTGSGALR